MKISFPHREVSLDIDDNTIPSIEERKKIVNALLAEKIEFHNETMTVEDYLGVTWEKQPTKTILDLLGYYLAKESFTEDELDSEDEIKEDRYIISLSKMEEMETGSKRHTTFTSMGKENHYKLGLTE